MVAFYTLSNVLIKSMASPLFFFFYCQWLSSNKKCQEKGFFSKVDKLSKWNNVCRKKQLIYKKKYFYTEDTLDFVIMLVKFILCPLLMPICLEMQPL